MCMVVDLNSVFYEASWLVMWVFCCWCVCVSVCGLSVSGACCKVGWLVGWSSVYFLLLWILEGKALALLL